MRKKHILAVTMTVILIATGVSVVPKAASAAEETVIYEDITVPVDGSAPTKGGYVFGGWCNDSNQVLEEKPTTQTAKAKWVPAYVLSVKAQINADSQKDDGKNSTLRLLTSVDSKHYKKVGFDIWLSNKTGEENKFKGDNGEETASAKVYKNVMVNNTSKEAKDVFGNVSESVAVYWLTDIDDEHDGTIIYVRPYWVTPDGTKVSGLARYVHVEDGYLGYITVPVNILDAKNLAAGGLDVTLDETLELVGIEDGRVLPQMQSNVTAGQEVTANDTIKLVGNATTVDKYHDGEVLYANLRFKKPNAEGENVTFTMRKGMFCDWQEIEKKVTVWDYTN